MPYHNSLGKIAFEEVRDPIRVDRTPQPTVTPEEDFEPEITPVVMPEDEPVTDNTYVEVTDPEVIDPGGDPYTPAQAGQELPTFIDVAAEQESPWLKWGLLLFGGYVLVSSYRRNRR